MLERALCYPSLCPSIYKIAVSVNGNVLEMHKICKRGR